jgi:hypothetical protein
LPASVRLERVRPMILEPARRVFVCLWRTMTRLWLFRSAQRALTLQERNESALKVGRDET